ncbi:CC0125/CC1285 family lipoprotein [Hyphobacterium sp.]|uniref:CC0125/CC1285 family lipoprotein n=1 Tax=Hyphobacterium sp. TaxID=2004662 RepID=UPI003BAA5B79
MRTTAILLASAFVLGACATATPYQASGTGAGNYGYSEQAIERDRYRITFSGNSLTDRETVETYLLYRAAELTQQRGYQHFTVVQRATDEDTRTFGSYVGDPFYSSFYVNYRYYHPRWGWYGWRDPFWDDVRYRETTRYEASAEIVMGRRGSGNGADDFTASEVLRNLGPNIVRPTES